MINCLPPPAALPGGASPSTSTSGGRRRPAPITQPALSMQIKELERELKVVLVERRRQGMQLTEEGREVARRAARIVTDVRDLVDYARHRNSALSGPLHLGVIPSVAPYLLPPLLPRAAGPLSRPRAAPARDPHRPAACRAGRRQLDVLVLALPVEGHDVETLALFEDPFFLAVPSWHKLSGKVRATPELSRTIACSCSRRGTACASRRSLIAICGSLRSWTRSARPASPPSCRWWRVASESLCCPGSAWAWKRGESGIKLLRFAEPAPARTLGLAWRATSPRRHASLALAELIRGVDAAAEVAGANGERPLSPADDPDRGRRSGRRSPPAPPAAHDIVAGTRSLALLGRQLTVRRRGRMDNQAARVADARQCENSLTFDPSLTPAS